MNGIWKKDYDKKINTPIQWHKFSEKIKAELSIAPWEPYFKNKHTDKLKTEGLREYGMLPLILLKMES
jgi:hypothetical protein